MSIISRSIDTIVLTLKEQYPILSITGPRQSGKTTFLKHFFNDYRYVSLENKDEREFATNDPNGFLKKYDNKVIFDEAQYVPELFSYLQTKVDESGATGQFILSGSQNFLLLQNITQSLAGRVAIIKLLPFDFKELQLSSNLNENWMEMAVKGFYPALYQRNINSSIYFNNYIETYIERDVRMLQNVHNLEIFRKFLKICAHRVGQLFNINHIANECGISQPTAKSWLSLLESSYIIFKVAPYFENFSKRVIKTPKMYFYDTGLLCYLLSIKNADELSINILKGSIFENMIIAETQKKNYHNYLLKDYYFWRDSNGHEVDLLTTEGNILEMIEIKSTQTITNKLFLEMDYLEKIIPTYYSVQKNLIYSGTENQMRTNYKIWSWSQ
jgi:predicted AAA+ superfamily ATPase